MARILLDTCAVIDLTTDPAALNEGVWDVINDYGNRICISAETARELVIHFNNKRLLPKFWKTAKDMLLCIERDYMIDILPTTKDIMHTYADLQLNEAQDHRDPSDHIIISHAITEHLMLLSSDTKFPFYREQGLDLIEY